MKDNIERRLTVVVVAALLVLTVAASVAVRNIHRSIASSDWVNHTHAVIMEADAIGSSLRAAEAALRDFLLTGDARDKAAFQGAFSDVAEHFEVAKALTRNEPQRDRFGRLGPLIAKRVEFAREVERVRQQEGLDGARKLFATNGGGATVKEIMGLIEKLKDDAKAQLQERDRASYRQAQATRWTVMICVALNFMLVGFAGWLVRDDLAARRRITAVLKDANAQLEGKVGERTAELVRANQTLSEENLERRWANQALDHQLRYSQLVINSIGTPILVISNALNITRLNCAVTQLAGWQPAELVGGPLSRLLQPLPGDEPGGPAINEMILNSLKAGHEVQDHAGLLQTKAGRAMPVCVSVFPLRDRDKVVGGVVTARLSYGNTHVH